MILKGIAATTQVDAHNTRIALEALESAAETVVHGNMYRVLELNMILPSYPSVK